MDEDASRQPEADVSATEARPAAQVAPAVRPASARVLGAQAVELATFAVAIIGALALGLGITDYLSDHLEVLAYLAAYAGFRVAQILMTAQPDAIVDLVKACSGALGDLPALLLFAAAPFERTYAAGGEAPIWITAIGLLMGLSGFWLALGAQIQIDRATESAQASMAGPPLIRTGLFRYIRHPSYAGQWLAWMGWPLIYSAPITAAAMLVGGALVVGQQIREEETRMLERFGEEYASYMRETDRLIPSLW
jgi:protein-S-isoprenylcysteine O-methyltransferase Ste14